MRASDTSFRNRLALSGVLAVALIASIAGVATLPASAKSQSGGTVTFAQQPGNVPNYIFPITAANSYVSGNLTFFQPLLWRPLYWLGDGTKPVISKSLSLADPPTFSDGGRTVNITLKPYKWSDGQPVTSRDVEFFLNLLKAGKNNWGGYSPGEFPDNVASFAINSPSSFSLTFNNVYAREWIENNELSAIVPLPQQAWDKTSASGAVGDYDLTASGATAVYNYLNQQALSLNTYATNPLWQEIDGPFRMTAYSAETNYVAFAPNPHYSGPIKPRISKLIEAPFTSEFAEYDALRSGQVDYGYLPSTDLHQTSYFKAKGDTVEPWSSWGVDYMVINFTNPKLKSYFKQLYIRQALQLTVNQPALIKDTLNGYGQPIDGPIPIDPKGPLVSPLEAKNPYPYNPAKAAKLLREHGWKVVRDGTDTCLKPGDGSGQCGAGIAKGAALSFPVIYPSGVASIADGVQAWKSWASTVGITLNIRELPLQQIGDIANICTTGATCTWGLANWEGWGFQSPYPTGEETFSAIQTGGYRSATNDANITATQRSSNPSAMFNYEDYLAKNLPVIWWPNSPSQISVISGKLHEVTQNALGSFTPEEWSLRG
ncbi:MAG TPA: ABC transporter substrate-binding protein [Candidatus Dormibacteraeota bacterium]